MNFIVLVPLIRPPTSWVKRPNLLADERVQMTLVAGLVISSRYSKLLPVIGSITALAYQSGMVTMFLAASKSVGNSVSGVDWLGIGVTLAASFGFGGSATLGSALLKMVASCCRDVSWAAPIGWNGAAGDGCWRAWIRSWEACWAASCDDSFGMGIFEGKNSTVLAMRYNCVLVIYRW